MQSYLAALLLLAFAASSVSSADLGSVAHKEVAALLKAHPNLNMHQCVHKCDEIFKFLNVHDEKHTDHLCHNRCHCFITLKDKCHAPHPGHTHRPHTHQPHTHRPHTHRPHTHRPHSHGPHTHRPHTRRPHTHRPAQ